MTDVFTMILAAGSIGALFVAILAFQRTGRLDRAKVNREVALVTEERLREIENTLTIVKTDVRWVKELIERMERRQS